MQSTKKIIVVIFLSLLIGTGSSFCLSNFLEKFIPNAIADPLDLDEQEATIRAIKKVMPAVVSITVYDWEEVTRINLDTDKTTTEQKRVSRGSGSGFLISSDGYILTNKHVVSTGSQEEEETAEYQVTMSNNKQYYAQFIGKDKLKDLAVIKIFDKDLPYVELGDSSKLEIGTTVIAIGNALGRYQNSVTKGIVSGLNRELEVINNENQVEVLYGVIQTDAEINTGNSGGPLVDLLGKVVGVNTAMYSGGGSFGFTIPINDARGVVDSVKKYGLIIRPRLGVQYIMLNKEMAEFYKVNQQEGALLIESVNGGSAVVEGSPAEKAGLEKGDIILEVNAVSVVEGNNLFSIIQKYNVGDRIGLRVLRGDEIIIKIVTLDRF